MQETRIHTLIQGPKLGQSGCLMPFYESAFQALSFDVSNNLIPQPHVGAEGHGPHHGVKVQLCQYRHWFCQPRKPYHRYPYLDSKTKFKPSRIIQDISFDYSSSTEN